MYGVVLVREGAVRMWYVNVLMKRKGRLAKRVVDINMVFFNSLHLKGYAVAND